MKYSLIDRGKAPDPKTGNATKSVELYNELVASLAPGKAARVELSGKETPRGVKASITRAAKRAVAGRAVAPEVPPNLEPLRRLRQRQRRETPDQGPEQQRPRSGRRDGPVEHDGGGHRDDEDGDGAQHGRLGAPPTADLRR